MADQVGPTAQAAPPQLSADGRYWWTGNEWTPVRMPPPPPSPPVATPMGHIIPAGAAGVRHAHFGRGRMAVAALAEVLVVGLAGIFVTRTVGGVGGPSHPGGNARHPAAGTSYPALSGTVQISDTSLRDANCTESAAAGLAGPTFMHTDYIEPRRSNVVITGDGGRVLGT